MSGENARQAIAGIAAYAPRRRIETAELADAWGQSGAAGITQSTVPDADEDTLTMAAEAATDALNGAEVPAESLASVLVATTTPPLEEEAFTARLASFLGLEDVATTQLTGSTAAGVNALRVGLSADDGPGLVVASDAPRGAPDSDLEHAAGAGAAALVLDADGSGTVDDVASRTDAYPGTRSRERGDEDAGELGITQYERTAFVETLGAVASDLEYDGDELDAAAIQAPNGKLPYRAAGALGVSNEHIQAGTTVHDLGDTGAANPLLGLAGAVAEGAERVLLAGYGSGAEATAMMLDVGGVPATVRTEGTETVTYAEYLRLRGEITPGEPEGGGAYVSVPSWRRTLAQRHRLEVGECASCGGLNLAPEGACDVCHELTEYERVTVPGTGTIEAVTVIGQGGAPPEFVEQQARSGAFVSAVVALDGPEDDDRSVSLPMQVVTGDDEEPTIGDRVETTIRHVYTQEGLPRYGRKAILADSRR